jgi:hypothetical protein
MDHMAIGEAAGTAGITLAEGTTAIEGMADHKYRSALLAAPHAPQYVGQGLDQWELQE